MAPHIAPNAAEGDPSAAVSAAVELLEVLRARGQDGAGTAVSPSQLRALLVVEEAEGINLRSLGAVLGSRPPSVTRLCDRMAAMGLLERTPSRTSRREVELRLTAQGRALLDEQRVIRLREMSAVLARMEPAAIDALVAGLSGFREAAGGVFAHGDAAAGPSGAGPGGSGPPGGGPGGGRAPVPGATGPHRAGGGPAARDGGPGADPSRVRAPAPVSDSA
ncbi:hypothetical protein GCM10010371_47150 [Streptomyces subrutilus]|uniref:HTH marR-type domain-containing protein n=1 Tax=Streptomyces subrutilus TaxID=36818 RepID=A0A918R133_9ACTN|nr:hypothetical protein GCM10010371_47150 [Streptomyces subrutilus]